ncbi:hypothetical protein OS493_024050 [Desmophyllum pertusum]|uniref:Uncharacterized protein n=1 Tax=Desmophyllum pertusum TaxID=174260 RepID=A0A9W9ZM35_9CNID|nr:hypothetical protein OS493_024050 [Desmophyllum pertusum]
MQNTFNSVVNFFRVQENQSPDKPEESLSHQENVGDNPPETMNGSPTDKDNPAVNNEKRNSEGGQLYWKDYATVGIVGGTAAVVAAPLALAAAGFTTGGVAAGSIAAGIQSSVYGGCVGASSAFAVLQSAGAAGIGIKTAAGIFTAGVGAATYLKSKVAPSDEGPKCSSHQE